MCTHEGQVHLGGRVDYCPACDHIRNGDIDWRLRQRREGTVTVGEDQRVVSREDLFQEAVGRALQDALSIDARRIG